MTAVAVSLTGQLTAGRPGTTCTPDPLGSMAFDLDLLDKNEAFSYGVQAGSKLARVTTTGSFTALAIPSGVLGRVLYFKPVSGTIIALELTFATTGVVELPIAGTLLLEAAEQDEVTAAGVKGSGEFEWCVAGPVSS